MKLKSILFACLCMLAGSSLSVYSQVTIGSGTEPERGAALEINGWKAASPVESDVSSLVNSTKGVLFPKVALQAYNLLTPLYGDPDASTAEERLLATGMLVYNINAAANGLEVGFHYWDGKEWLALKNSSGIANLEFQDCESIEILGNYIVNQPLNPTSNYITLNVNVTSPGAYSLLVTTSPDNGYYFSASGVFQKTGVNTIVLNGAGAPLAVGQNELEFSINNRIFPLPAGCNKYITVSDRLPAYSFNCSNISVSTNLTANVAPTIDDVIKIRVIAPESSAGASYSISTNQINGLSFIAEGTLTGGSQLITLEANGTPQMSGDYTFIMTTNSTSTSVDCPVRVSVAARAMDVLVVTYTSGNSGDRDILGSGASVNLMLLNPALFSNNNDAVYRVGGLNITKYDDGVAQATIRNLLTSVSPPDIVILSYDFVPDVTTRQTLIDYVNGGGVLIYCTDHTADARQTAVKTIVDGIFSSNVTVNTSSNGPASMPLLAGNPVVEGLYRDLSGRYMGRDGCCNFEIAESTLPADALILMRGSNNQPRSIMHTTKGFVLIGDGGPFAGYPADGNTVDYPCRTDASGNPVVVTTYDNPIYNSYFFVNLMAWAIEYVQTYRPESGRIITP